jgi:DNA-binding HxlR family transcriptional regulator
MAQALRAGSALANPSLVTYYLIVPTNQEDARLAHIDEATCRLFQAAAELAGQKWNAAILMAAARGATRFSEFREMVHGISDRVLSARLRELERRDLLMRDVIATMPVQVHYSLTPRGGELITVLQPLVGWGQRWSIDAKD